MIKRALCLLLALLLCGSASLAYAAPDPTPVPIPQPTLSPDAPPYDAEHPELLEEEQLYAQSAILIESGTGNVIFEKNSEEIMYPASTTKILTVLLGILMVEDLDMTVTVSESAMNIADDSSTMGLQAGEEISFRDLLYGTMMRSANEGANVIAETVSGSVPAFVELMNRAAVAFGCTNTHFANPHGYMDPDHYTTAADMALIAREAMKDETFRNIAAATTYTVPRTNMHRPRSLTTRSTILIPGTEENANKYYYEYATGIKTGSHSQAGYCFVGSASRGGVDLISVCFFTSRSGEWTDTKKLMEYGFSQYMSVTPIDLYNMNPITVETSNYSLNDKSMGKLPITCVPNENTVTVHIVDTKDVIETMAENLRSTMLFQYTRDFAAPIEAGEVMGTMSYFAEDGTVSEYNLIAGRTVAKRENAPKTLEEIVAETEADPNPFPPITVELVVLALLPFVLLALLIHILRRIHKKRKSRGARVPKPKSRYLK